MIISDRISCWTETWLKINLPIIIKYNQVIVRHNFNEKNCCLVYLIVLTPVDESFTFKPIFDDYFLIINESDKILINS